MKSLQKDTETNTEDTYIEIYNILLVGRQDDFCSLIKNVGNGKLDGNIVLHFFFDIGQFYNPNADYNMR